MDRGLPPPDGLTAAAPPAAIAPALGRRCRTAAKTVALRVATPEAVEDAWAARGDPMGKPVDPGLAAGAAGGFAGLAIACAAFDAAWPGEGWDRRGHEFLARAARGLALPGARPGLLDGRAGLALAAGALARGGERYGGLRESVESAVAADALRQQQPTPKDGLLAYQDVDLVSGPTGIAAALSVLRARPACAEALDATVNRLVALVDVARQRPRWWIAPQSLWQGLRKQAPDGLAEIGVAHGVAGVVAALSLVRLEDDPRADRGETDEAIAALAHWLGTQRSDDENGPNWPNGVPRTAAGRRPERLSPTHAGWCRGATGIAWALWLAGGALDDGVLRGLALRSLAAVARRSEPERAVDTPGLCHGLAGLLAVSLRFAADAGSPEARRLAAEQAGRLCDLVDPATPLALREPRGGELVEPGLLMGAAGVALALLDASDGGSAAPWHRLFVLA